MVAKSHADGKNWPSPWRRIERDLHSYDSAWLAQWSRSGYQVPQNLVVRCHVWQVGRRSACFFTILTASRYLLSTTGEVTCSSPSAWPCLCVYTYFCLSLLSVISGTAQQMWMDFGNMFSVDSLWDWEEITNRSSWLFSDFFRFFFFSDISYSSVPFIL